jgi:hypothetical protein
MGGTGGCIGIALNCDASGAGFSLNLNILGCIPEFSSSTELLCVVGDDSAFGALFSGIDIGFGGVFCGTLE